MVTGRNPVNVRLAGGLDPGNFLVGVGEAAQRHRQPVGQLFALLALGVGVTPDALDLPAEAFAALIEFGAGRAVTAPGAPIAADRADLDDEIERDVARHRFILLGPAAEITGEDEERFLKPFPGFYDHLDRQFARKEAIEIA